MSALIVETPIDPRTCLHQEIEELGHDGEASFFRCVGCGSVVIGSGNHRWIIRPTDVRGPLPF